jgi:hypothetical protein
MKIARFLENRATFLDSFQGEGNKACEGTRLQQFRFLHSLLRDCDVVNILVVLGFGIAILSRSLYVGKGNDTCTELSSFQSFAASRLPYNIAHTCMCLQLRELYFESGHSHRNSCGHTPHPLHVICKREKSQILVRHTAQIRRQPCRFTT